MLQDWIDQTTIHTWHYPVDFPVRSYQHNIVYHCLFKNTLVSLPTGLGKTFIAGVVMMNYLRWFPFGKVCFLAPTRPLVAQQRDACTKVGIEDACMIELTGSTPPARRQEHWKSKRVFFMTPHILHNDIMNEICPTQFIVCVIVDESHRAQGKYSYCEGIRELHARNPNFRVVALTATPGSNSQAVQKIVDNLFIAHIEIRTEESIDIRPYMHRKKIQSIVVDLTEELGRIKGILEKELLSPILQTLYQKSVSVEQDPTKIGTPMILRIREQFRQRVANGTFPNSHVIGLVEYNFAALMSFVYCYELLLVHGIYNFYNHLNFVYTDQSSKLKGIISQNPVLVGLLNGLKVTYSALSYNSIQKSHPKMKHLETELVNFFQSNSASKAIVFAQYRDTVNQIVALLQHYPSLIKVASFVGKSDSKSLKGINQKEQMQVVNQFREGAYNVLVSTSIGEEGLDIGEVDLIVCYDAHTSPIRMLQRFGRTGRKRNGNVLMLLTKGKEEHKHKQTNFSYKSVQNAIVNKSLTLYAHNPRMVPERINPTCVEVTINAGEDFCFDESFERASVSEQSSEQLLTPLFINKESAPVNEPRQLSVNVCKETINKESPILVSSNNSMKLTKSCKSSSLFVNYLKEEATSGLENIERIREILFDIYNGTSFGKAESPPSSLDDNIDFYDQNEITTNGYHVSSLDLEAIPDIDKVFDDFNQHNDGTVDDNIFVNPQNQPSVQKASIILKSTDKKDSDLVSNPILNQHDEKDDFDSLEVPSEFFCEDWTVEDKTLESPRFLPKKGMNLKFFIGSQSDSPTSPMSAKRSTIQRSPLPCYNSKPRNVTSPLSTKTPNFQRSKKRPFAAVGNFLDVEAENSQDYISTDQISGCSSYEDDEELASFIDDASEELESEANNSSQQFDFYRQSILMSQMPEFNGRANKFGKDGKFKLVM